MMGGGYRLSIPPFEDLPQEGTPTFAFVEASYPSSDNTWTVRVRNPGPTNILSRTIVFAYSY
jgi:hypothetical protein